MSFENNIQRWVQLDNELKRLNEQTRQLREQRNSLESSLTNYVKHNNMKESVVQINNDKLKFVETKVQEPLTFKYLEKSLGEIIKDENKVKMIMEHLKQKRAVKLVSEIKRF